MGNTGSQKLHAVLEILKRIAAETGDDVIKRAEYQLIRRLPVSDVNTVRNHLDDLADHGIIQIISRSGDTGKGWVISINSNGNTQQHVSKDDLASSSA